MAPVSPGADVTCSGVAVGRSSVPSYAELTRQLLWPLRVPALGQGIGSKFEVNLSTQRPALFECVLHVRGSGSHPLPNRLSCFPESGPDLIPGAVPFSCDSDGFPLNAGEVLLEGGNGSKHLNGVRIRI